MRCVRGRWQDASTADVPFVIRSVDLNQKSVGIPELKRFLVAAGLHFQIARLQFSYYIVRIESCDSEVIVIESWRRTLLFNSKEALSNSQDVSLFRMLLQGHPKKLLIELGGAVNVGDAHGNVV